MKTQHARAAIVSSLLLTASACSSLNSIEHISPGSPQYFTGTRLNVAAIQGDRSTLERFAYYSMLPAEYPVLDLPLSLVMDTTYLLAEFCGLPGC